ncbi:MAG: hypothetical protein AAF141_14165, partial [Pseudomonadota bacterium]
GLTACRAIGIARFAGAGVNGPETAFEDTRGFLRLLNGGIAKREVLSTLGYRWRLVEPGLLFKSNPVCSAAHAAIDQMQTLMSDLNAAADDIVEIRAEVPELVFISLVYPDPQTPQEAQFSLPFVLACVARYGRVRFEDLTLEALHDPALRALMEKVQVVSVPDLSTDEMRARYPESARLTVTLKSGMQSSGFRGSAKGMPGNPQNNTELKMKFETACAFAGLRGPIEAKVGDNPAATFARLMA